MRVLWTPEAHQDRAVIWNYLCARDARAAARIDRLFSEAAARLADFPQLGHAGEVPGTRELTPHESYRMVYEIFEDTVWILALIHTRRQWPPVQDRAAKR